MYRDKGSINLVEMSSMYEMRVGGKVAILSYGNFLKKNFF